MFICSLNQLPPQTRHCFVASELLCGSCGFSSQGNKTKTQIKAKCACGSAHFNGVWWDFGLWVVKTGFVPVLQGIWGPEIWFFFPQNVWFLTHRLHNTGGNFSPHQTFKGSGEIPKYGKIIGIIWCLPLWADCLESCCSTLYFDLFPLFSQSQIFKHRAPTDTNILTKKKLHFFLENPIKPLSILIWFKFLIFFLMFVFLLLFSRVVKEEISDDNAKLPCFNGRVVSWVGWILCVQISVISYLMLIFYLKMKTKV